MTSLTIDKETNDVPGVHLALVKGQCFLVYPFKQMFFFLFCKFIYFQ